MYVCTFVPLLLYLSFKMHSGHAERRRDEGNASNNTRACSRFQHTVSILCVAVIHSIDVYNIVVSFEELLVYI